MGRPPQHVPLGLQPKQEWGISQKGGLGGSGRELLQLPDCRNCVLCACVPVLTLDVFVVLKEAKTARAGDRVPSFCLSFWTCPVHHGVCPAHVPGAHLKCSRVTKELRF